MPTIKIILFILALSVGFELFANEEAAKEEAHAGGGEHGSEHGEGKSSATPWMEVESKVQELSAKIKSKQKMLLDLFEEKNKLKNNTAELKAKVQEILKEYSEMRKLAEEYDKQLSLLKYRFPERNAKAERKYDRFEMKSVDEMEQAMGIDGKLSRNMKKMRTQFKSAAPVAEAKGKKEATSTTMKKSEGSIEEADSVILQK